jgi:Domain of unknown function (DUF4350)
MPTSSLKATTKADLFWSAAVVLLVVGHFWFPKFGAGRGHDTYSTDLEGKKAFYTLMKSDPDGRKRTVRRNIDPFSKFLDSRSVYSSGWNKPTANRTLCLLGPARYPNVAEWDKLLEWVGRGGRLIIAARDAKPEFRIETLGIEVRRVRGGIDADAGEIQTSLIDRGQILWRSNAQIFARRAEPALLSAQGTRQVVRQRHGNGWVIVVAGDFIFSNQAMTYADQSNAVLALGILDAAQAEEYVFDESLNISGTPKVVGLLFNPLFKPMALQMLIGLVLFAWWRSRRFGPLLPEQSVARRNIVDHTDSVGVLLYRSGDGAAALRAYLRQLFGELKLKSYRGREERVIEPLAHRLGKSPEAVKRVLQRAVKASKSAQVDRHDAAYMLRQLAVIRRAGQMERQPKKPKERERAQQPEMAVR